MVFYECIVTAKNTAHFFQLTDLMKRVSHEIVDGGGIVRAIHNHGIRDLPHRFQAKFANRFGVRYYNKGRFVSIYYESNPLTMKQVEQVLAIDEEVLRATHVKARSILDFVNITREERNPYVKHVKNEDRLLRKLQRQQQQDHENIEDEANTNSSTSYNNSDEGLSSMVDADDHRS